MQEWIDGMIQGMKPLEAKLLADSPLSGDGEPVLLVNGVSNYRPHPYLEARTDFRIRCDCFSLTCEPAVALTVLVRYMPGKLEHNVFGANVDVCSPNGQRAAAALIRTRSIRVVTVIDGDVRSQVVVDGSSVVRHVEHAVAAAAKRSWNEREFADAIDRAILPPDPDGNYARLWNNVIDPDGDGPDWPSQTTPWDSFDANNRTS